MALPAWIGKGQTFEDPQAFSKWVDATPQAQVQQVAKDFNVDPTTFTSAYNLGKGTGFTTGTGAQWLDQVAPGGPRDVLQPDKIPGSKSSSGLPDWATGDLLSKLIPELTKSFADMPGQIDEWAEKNLASSHSASKNLLDGHLTSLLADLSKRGMMGGEGSTVSSDALSDLGTGVAKQQAGADLAILGQGAKQKFQVPGLLGQLAGLGQQSKSETSDPLAPYKLYSNMLLGMQ